MTLSSAFKTNCTRIFAGKEPSYRWVLTIWILLRAHSPTKL